MTWLILLAAEAAALWLGYQIGHERGEAKAQSKRNVRTY
jgi:hypothetical protein